MNKKINSYSRRRFLGVAALAIIGTKLPSPLKTELSSLSRATEWINSSPLTAEALQGKVVLVNFCTYTCINWLRSLPYVRAWSEKYKDLVVIGVHTPEFAFEKDLSNVRTLIKDLQVPYAIAVDNDYAIWKGFNNNYWPASYFIDAKGRVQHTQFGEGEYDKSEKVIQQLLEKAGAKNIDPSLVTINPRGVEVQPDWPNIWSAENYLGYDRTQGFSSLGNAVLGKARDYMLPTKYQLNQWALSGNWTFNKNAVVLNQPGGKIACAFHARDVHMVLGPSPGRESVRYRVFIDGIAARASRGVDVDVTGGGVITQQRMYQLIRQPGVITNKLFEIEFMDPGVEGFAFTFG